MQCSICSKGERLKVVDDYTFRKDRLCKKGQKWRCTRRICRMTLLTDPADGTLIKSERFHNHGKHVCLPPKHIFNGLKRKAIDDITERPAKLARRETVTEPADICQQVTREEVGLTHQNACVSRYSTSQCLSKDTQDVHDATDGMKMNISAGDQLLLTNDRAKNIIILAAGEDLRFFLQYESGRVERCENVERVPEYYQI